MKIVFTSDLHSYLFPTRYAVREEKNMGHYRIIGSYTKDEDTLVIDNGDNIQGSALSKYVMDQKVFSPFPQAAAMKAGGVDYMIPGNHDFNYGYEAFSRFFSQSGARILCANLLDKTGKLDIVPHMVFTDSTGLRVGITGLVTDYVNVWEHKENLTYFSILDVRESAEKELKWLKANADVSVLCYHGGYECDLRSGEVLQDHRENIGYELCRDLDYDLILTGHQHRSIPLTEICGTKTMQCPAFASGYCSVEIDRDGIRGEILPPREWKSVGEEENKAFGDKVEEWLDKKIGTIDSAIPAPDRVLSALKGNHIADFFNYVQMEATGADISCCGLNNELFSFPREMTVRDILASYQYPNSLCVLEVGEKEIRAALERSASFFTLRNGKPEISREFLHPKAEMYNYDYYMGISYSYDISRPIGERVTRLLYKGEEIGERKLKMAVNNYRATGAGGYSVYPKCRVLGNYDLDIQDLSVEFFLMHKGETISWPYSDFTTSGY